MIKDKRVDSEIVEADDFEILTFNLVSFFQAELWDH